MVMANLALSSHTQLVLMELLLDSIIKGKGFCTAPNVNYAFEFFPVVRKKVKIGW